MKKISKYLVGLIGLFSEGVFAETSSYISVLSGTNGAVVYKYSIERTNDEIKGEDLKNKGFSSPLKALETFYYLSKQGKLKNVIDMQFEEDGTKRYITELLYDEQEAFAGAKNLRTIKDMVIVSIGLHKIVVYTVSDNTGQAFWFDDFVCKNEVCKKSHFLNLFGNTDDVNQINYFIRYLGSLEKADDRLDLSKYHKIKVNSEYFGGKPDLELFLKVQKAGESSQKEEWYRLLDKINAIKQGDQENLAANLNQYIRQVFSDWDKEKFISFRFSSTRIEKDWLVNNLAVVKDLTIDSYIDVGKFVWVFVRSKSPDESSSNFVFLYEKASNKFLLNPYRTKGGGAIMSPMLEKEIFPELTKGGIAKKQSFDTQMYIYKPKIDRKLLNGFLKTLR